jgi:hypothetical protein
VNQPAFLLTALALLSSCATQARHAEPVLPFHIALVPIQCAPLSEATETPDAPPQDGGMKFEVDPSTLATRLQSALETRCFPRVTLLTLPSGIDAAEFASWPADRREAYWVAQAASADADMILEGELRTSPQIQGSTNEKFWLNLPLFFAGGPFCYFIDDNAYRGEARLDAWLYDLKPIAASRATLSDGRSELAHVQARFMGTDLSFLARAGGNVGLYAVSIVVPAGLLAHDGAHVEQRVGEDAIDSLANGLTAELRSDADQVLLGERVSSFHVSAASRLTYKKGIMQFSGAALLHVGEIQRLDIWRLEADGSSTEGDFADGVQDMDLTTERERYLRYPLMIHVACKRPREARLTLVGGGRNAITRTFTFELDLEHDQGEDVTQAR